MADKDKPFTGGKTCGLCGTGAAPSRHRATGAKAEPHYNDAARPRRSAALWPPIIQLDAATIHSPHGSKSVSRFGRWPLAAAESPIITSARKPVGEPKIFSNSYIPAIGAASGPSVLKAAPLAETGRANGYGFVTPSLYF